MATIIKGEIKGRRGRLEKTEDGHVYTETRKYIVLSDIRTESPYAVTATSGLPIVGLSVLGSTGARCKSIDPEQDDKNPQKWTVTAEFSTEKVDQKEDPEDPTNPDPRTWIPVYRGVMETYPEVMYRDSDGKAYVNSAGDRFPEPLIKQRPIIVYEFSQYEDPSVGDKEIGDRSFSMNSSVFKEWPAWTLLLTVKSFERGYFYGFETVRIDYRLSYKKGILVSGAPAGWRDTPLDIGYSYNGTGGKVHSPTLVALDEFGNQKGFGAAADVKIFKAPTPSSFTFLR